MIYGDYIEINSREAADSLKRVKEFVREIKKIQKNSLLNKKNKSIA